jgi:hypothetical protein
MSGATDLANRVQQLETLLGNLQKAIAVPL